MQRLAGFLCVLQGDGFFKAVVADQKIGLGCSFVRGLAAGFTKHGVVCEERAFLGSAVAGSMGQVHNPPSDRRFSWAVAIRSRAWMDSTMGFSNLSSIVMRLLLQPFDLETRSDKTHGT
jgi:hypothetical protein